MNTTPINPEEGIDQTIETLIAAAPPGIRAFLTGSDRHAAIDAIAKKNGLTPEAAVALENNTILMLLGAYTLEDLVSGLEQAGVPEESARSVLADLSERVFRKIDAGSAPPPRPVPQAPRPAPVRSPLVERPSFSVPTPSKPLPERPIAPPIAPVQASATPPTIPIHPEVRTMAMDVEGAQRPHTEKQPVAVAAQNTSPQKASSVTPLPMKEPVRVLAGTPPVASPIKNDDVPRREDVDADLKKYGVDPYREPIV